jgi:N-acetylmuramic acid 6-phosphate (MurNAc-6-P) etherase
VSGRQVQPRTAFCRRVLVLFCSQADGVVSGMFNHEDMLVPMAVSQHLEAIARIIDRLTERVRRGGRVVYLGAGTSGRLGVLDASEMWVTSDLAGDMRSG